MDFTASIVATVGIFIRILEFLIIANAFLSWLPLGYDNPIVNIVRRLTEPILGPVRKLMERSIFGKGNMMVDFSPIVAFMLLEAINFIVINVLVRW